MSSVKKVWVFAEKQDALAQLCAGAAQLGQEVSAVVLGTKDEAEKMIKLSADKVYWLGNPKPEKMLEDYVETIADLLKKERPHLLLIQPSKRGMLIAGRLAAGLGTSVLVDASELISADESIHSTHMVYGGAAFRKEKALTETTIATVGAGVYTALPEDPARQGEVIEVAFVEPAIKIKRTGKKVKESVSVNLNLAKRIVSVGRGFKNQADIKMAEELAGLMEAEVGCSRPVAEGLNWLPIERYVGISGAIVKPELYLAVGISGQVQHMVGISQSRVIVAINKDKQAPIFKQADYGIVGDLNKVLPLLIEKFKARKQ